MFGPALGYTIASFSLRQYIAPDLTPLISQEDPRWLGAWWLGWILLSCVTLFCAFCISLFPRELPRARLRRIISETDLKCDNNKIETNEIKKDSSNNSDMFETFKRVLSNKIFMLNNVAGVFYYFGYLPYWMFSPKYIESQYRQSAADSR